MEINDNCHNWNKGRVSHTSIDDNERKTRKATKWIYLVGHFE